MHQQKGVKNQKHHVLMLSANHLAAKLGSRIRVHPSQKALCHHVSHQRRGRELVQTSTLGRGEVATGRVKVCVKSVDISLQSCTQLESFMLGESKFQEGAWEKGKRAARGHNRGADVRGLAGACRLRLATPRT